MKIARAVGRTMVGLSIIVSPHESGRENGDVLYNYIYS